MICRNTAVLPEVEVFFYYVILVGKLGFILFRSKLIIVYWKNVYINFKNPVICLGEHGHKYQDVMSVCCIVTIIPKTTKINKLGSVCKPINKQKEY